MSDHHHKSHDEVHSHDHGNSKYEIGEITWDTLREHSIPFHLRDDCLEILLPLNVCRREHFYSPFHCKEERHAYERCLYLE